MKQFDWEKFNDEKNKIVVHCKTKKEAKKFCKLIIKNSIYYEDDELETYIGYFNLHKELTCYGVYGFGSVNYYSSAGYTILEWSDYMEEKETKEQVNHPTHYNRDGAMECIEEMVALFGKEETRIFCKLNAWKYRYRAGMKGSAKEDMEKSDWYIRKAKELLE